MTSRAHILVLCTLLLGACQNEIWLSTDAGLDASDDAGRDAGLDASLDAHVDPPRDTGVPDADTQEDSSIPTGRACETESVSIVHVRDAGPLDAPTFAASGRLTTLRFAVLVPPAASVTTTDDTQLFVLDDGGATLHERAIRIEDGTGAVTSSATLHSLSPLAVEQGFLLLTPRAIRMLDANGADTAETAPLTTAPNRTWQRSAGWLDADRFVFVSDTPDLRLAVFDRRTSEVTTTSISATNAGAIHVDPGGITIANATTPSEAVVYDADLTGTETLRVLWGELLGSKLLGAAVYDDERTWLVRDASEFRTNMTDYQIQPDGTRIAGSTTPVLGPLTATRAGPFVAMVTEAPSLVLYGFLTHAFSTIAMGFEGTALVEHERDGENVAVLFLAPRGGETSLSLACGRH